MAKKKQNYYQERPTSDDDFRRYDQSKDLASKKIHQLALLPLLEKKALIRELLIETGTDVDQNDSDPTGDGDQDGKELPLRLPCWVPNFGTEKQQVCFRP